MQLIPRFALWPVERVAPPLLYDPALMRQYRFEDSELIDEVTEIFAVAQNATYEGGELVTTANVNSRFDAARISFNAGDDFTISLDVTPISVHSSQGAMLLGVWNVGGGNNNSFTLYLNPNFTVGFVCSENGNGYAVNITSNDVLAANTKRNVVLQRKDGVVSLFIHGVQQAQTANFNGALYASTKHLSTYWASTGGWLNGRRDNIRVWKEAKYDEDFTPEGEAPRYVRPAYSALVADDIRVQFGWRRNNPLNEVGQRDLVQMTSVTNTYGRMTSTTGRSRFSVPCAPFGSGDFTIECKFNLSSGNTTYGTPILAQWWGADQGGGVTSRWLLLAYTNGGLGFGMFRSKTANDRAWATAPAGSFALGRDNHICVERFDGILTLYVNRIPVMSSTAFDFPMVPGDDFLVHSLSENTAYTGVMDVWDVRVADRAMYKGSVSVPSVFPELPKFSIDLVKNGIPHEMFTVNGDAATVNGALELGAGKYLSAPSDPAFGLFRDDFTIKIDLNIESVPTVYGAQVTTLFGWVDFVNSGVNCNWELVQNHTTNQLVLNSWDQAGTKTPVSWLLDYTFPLQQDVTLTLVRQKGAITVYQGNSLVGSLPHTVDSQVFGSPQILINRRVGGTGNIVWYANLKIRNFTFSRGVVLPTTKNSVNTMSVEVLQRDELAELPKTRNNVDTMSVEVLQRDELAELPKTKNSVDTLSVELLVRT